VETRALNQAVRKNIERFPPDFMFQLTENECSFLKSHFVTSNTGRGGKQKLPLVFTEYGVAMLSSVLKSDQAIQVNISIMRTFGKLRALMSEWAIPLNQIVPNYKQFKLIHPSPPF
jgi:hypothetical protein